MRIRSLVMEGVGPFAGRHVINIDALGATGLFLLEGPTGAGKSTIIDAITFALYGKVASDDASDDRLRSTFADPRAESVVEVVFETSAGIFRVRRTPAYDRPKRSGNGTTRQNQTATLWRLGSDPADGDGVGGGSAGAGVAGEVISSRASEVGSEILRIVGLSRAQFVQTVVLPQGEFARFLRSDPEERGALLQRVFGTEIYEQLQDRLQVLRREANTAVAAAGDEVAQAVSTFAGSVGIARDDLPAIGDDGLAEAVAAVVTERQTAAEAAELTRAAAAEAEQQAAAQANAAVATAAAVVRRDDLRQRETALAAAGPANEARVAAIAAARRAAVVRPALLEQQAAAERAERSAVAAGQAVVVALSGAAGETSGADGAVTGDAADTEPAIGADVLDQRHAESLAAAARLDHLVTIEQELPTRQRAVADLQGELDAAIAALAEAEASAAVLPQRRDEAAAQVTELTAAVAGHGDTAAAVQRATEGVAAAEAAERAAAEASAAAEAATAAVQAARLANHHVATLRDARLTGIAAELAAGLVDGGPCPVCGSAEHPAPATAAADAVTADEVTAAQQACDLAERRVEMASSDAAAATARAGDARAAAAGRDPAEAQLALDTTKAEHEAAVAAEAARAAAVTHLATVDTDLAAARADVSAGAELTASLTAQLQAATTALTSTITDLAAARGEAATVVDVRSDLLAAAQRFAAAAAAVREADTAAAAAAQRVTAAAAAMAEHGFATAADVESAWLDARDITAEQALVDAHRDEAAQVTAAAQSPEIVAVADLTLDAAEQAAAATAAELAAARTRLDEAGSAVAVIAAQAAAAVQHAAAVSAAAARLVAATEQAAPVRRMADLAAGGSADNPHAISLSTHVLARRFGDVIAAANDRLRVMSDGRYELEASDQREDVRSRRRGLAMRVVDHVTDDTRDPRTLSGGETFYVALCLALGLADVVTAEAGGVELGTLFVDEGFGSLDPDTLDAVLSELSRLHAGGRVVGVISHVEALKQLIPERVEVRRLPDGSSTLRVTV